MAQTAKLFWSGRSQAVRLPEEFRMEGDEVHIRKQGAAVILEPLATDWQWLDDIAGKFSKDFFSGGRNQPEMPPSRDQRHWSLFRWRSKSSEWLDAADNENITLGRMVDLAAHCPEIAELLRKQRALAELRPEKTTGRRRRHRRRAF